jgi:hypothetical protein
MVLPTGVVLSRTAITLCKENRVLLLTIGVNCSEENQELLKAEYGKLVQFSETVNDLPGLMRNLLNQGKRIFLQ